MTLSDAVRDAIKATRAEMSKDEHGSDVITEFRIPADPWLAVMRAWREERTQEIAKQGLKELREAIYGESK